MMRSLPLHAVSFLLASCASTAHTPDETIDEHAARLTRDMLVVDTHVDVPYRLHEQKDSPDDVSQRTPGGHFDWVRAREGGLDAPFMSIYVPADAQATPGAARALADELIDMVEGIAARAPEKFEIARSTADVRRIAKSGRIALPMGIENGAAIEDDLANLRHFHGRGVRYITLTHSKANLVCDSSYDPEPRWKGLSPFGREVVAEMNRLGIMVDVSHVSDAAFDDVLAISRAPVIASHSSCRHFVPGFERNLDDERIQRLASAGGVIQINFGSAFVDAEANRRAFAGHAEIRRLMAEQMIQPGSAEAEALEESYRKEHPPISVPLAKVADHIDHVVALVGVEHVGIGSDYDGVSDVPVGLEDVSAYPRLVAELLRRGYSDTDLEKILGGNLMRVWAEVERIARPD